MWPKFGPIDIFKTETYFHRFYPELVPKTNKKKLADLDQRSNPVKKIIQI